MQGFLAQNIQRLADLQEPLRRQISGDVDLAGRKPRDSITVAQA